MDNIKDTIKTNLVRLRKEKKMTQLELAEKINYSDKAISRWEKGEVTPDIETLDKLSKIYDVPIETFFAKTEKKFRYFKLKKIEMGNKLAISLLAVLSVWIIALFYFIYMDFRDDTSAWTIFLWAIPVSCIVGIIFNAIWGKRIFLFVLVSLLIWTLITAFCVQMLINYNDFPWFVYIVGIPLQIGTILTSFISPRRHKKGLHEEEENLQ